MDFKTKATQLTLNPIGLRACGPVEIRGAHGRWRDALWHRTDSQTSEGVRKILWDNIPLVIIPTWIMVGQGACSISAV